MKNAWKTVVLSIPCGSLPPRRTIGGFRMTARQQNSRLYSAKIFYDSYWRLFSDKSQNPQLYKTHPSRYRQWMYSLASATLPTFIFTSSQYNFLRTRSATLPSNSASVTGPENSKLAPAGFPPVQAQLTWGLSWVPVYKPASSTPVSALDRHRKSRKGSCPCHLQTADLLC